MARLNNEQKETKQELIDSGAQIDRNNNVLLFHRTNSKSAEEIKKTGRMCGDEDGIFFSTSEKGQAEGYGSEVVKAKIHISKLEIDDIFDNEAHVRLPMKRPGCVRVPILKK